MDHEQPAGLRFVAGLVLLASSYLFVLALLMTVQPGAVPLALGEPLLQGLELAGPLMFFLAGAVGAALGIGLLFSQKWARYATAIVAIAGVVMLVPKVSGAVVNFQLPGLAWGGLGVIVRVAVARYLWQDRDGERQPAVVPVDER